MSRAHWLLVACATLVLAGCATARRPAPPASLPAVEPPSATAPTEPTPTAQPAPNEGTAAAPESAPVARDPLPAWPALAARFEFVRCDDAAAAVRRWIRVYTASPQRFEAMLRRALPFLGYVQGEVLASGLPGEFVLLPLVESSYVPFVASGNRPAGIWQFMPVTARHFGLAVGPAYDARLDVAAATRAAIEYLEYLGERFEHDWTLVNMAFNAGEYRVRGALARARRGGTPIAHDQLALSPITHEHFAKLTALACIVREPGRWNVQLPARDPQPQLAALPLAAATDIALLAHVARSDVASLERINPAARGSRLPAGAVALLPATTADAAAVRLDRVPRDLRTGWRMADRGSRDWDALARDGVDAALLAELNDSAPGSTPPPRVLVRSVSAASTVAARAPDASGRYAVRTGDSLWLIARRFGVSVASLLQWNALPTRHVLRPGQLLWVVAPR